MKQVLIIQSQMNQYRVPFFEKLASTLARKHVRLKVAYSDPLSLDAANNDHCDLPENLGLKVKGHWLWRERLIFQPLLTQALRSDLVIVEHANKFILNHLLLVLSRLGLQRVAFWGLGENRQEGQIAISEWYREKTAAAVVHCFAYTYTSAKYFAKAGVPEDRITVVQNAVDTCGLREQIACCTEAQVEAARQKLGISDVDPVGIYCGMLHRVKMLPFLMESARLIRNRIKNFHLLVVGGGPEEPFLHKEALREPWLHPVGALFGHDKALMFKLSHVALQPGRLGLVILDCFAAGIPLITTRIPIHGPEVDYLDDGINGLITNPNPTDFATAVTELLLDRRRLKRLHAGSKRAGAQYSIEAMVQKFSEGIFRCLNVRQASTSSCGAT